MSGVVDFITVVLLLLNFYLCGRSNLEALIHGVALQGILLSILTIFIHTESLNIILFLSASVTFGIKGILIPSLMITALRDVSISREINPIVSYTVSIFISVMLTFFSFWTGHRLEATLLFPNPKLIIVGCSMALCGLLLAITRRKAITQVIGYLVLENGIYVFGTSLSLEQSIFVELGVLLDVLVCVFIMGILIHRINTEYDSINTQSLEFLKE
ncbi:MAG: hypothetical protein JW795_22995 [Chitinivibrionales bacterium]|nr:hypothetical protein [Chitinivibrionales bacterium]